MAEANPRRRRAALRRSRPRATRSGGRVNADAFEFKPRQSYLTERYFELNRAFLRLLTDACVDAMKHGTDAGEPTTSQRGSVFKNALNLLKLHYTAGCPIEALKPLYADAMTALGEWHLAEREYSQWLGQKSGDDLRLDMTPLEFDDLYHYQLAIDVASLGVLLGEGDRLRQAARWMQSARGSDALFESLIEPAVPDPRDNTDYFHVRPYDPLIDALYLIQTPGQAAAKVAEYLQGWYRSFDGAPWHDGHRCAVEGQYMPYYGYWSFEAAAVCVIHGIDDSAFRDRLVYPKDLADWARANHSLAHL